MDDYKPNVTSGDLARCLVVLRTAEGPATAAQIAGKLNLGGNRESQRRKVRQMIARLRAAGHWVVATLLDGCWLTTDKEMWTDYCQHKMIDGKRIIGEASRRRQAVLKDTDGQGMLFFPNKIT